MNMVASTLIIAFPRLRQQLKEERAGISVTKAESTTMSLLVPRKTISEIESADIHSESSSDVSSSDQESEQGNPAEDVVVNFFFSFKLTADQPEIADIEKPRRIQAPMEPREKTG